MCNNAKQQDFITQEATDMIECRKIYMLYIYKLGAARSLYKSYIVSTRRVVLLFLASC